MRAGQLRHRLTVQHDTGTTVNSKGEHIPSWVTFGKRWGRIRPLTGRERFDAQQLTAEVDSEVTMRYLAGVTPAMRILFGTRLFDIEAPINPEERNRELRLLVKEQV